MIRAIAIAVLLLFGGHAWAQSVSFPSVTVGTSQAGPEVSGWISKPPGDGPFPAIILAHSCAGTGRHTDGWAKLLVSWGYLVLAPDSFNPRGTKAVCTTPNVVTPNMRVADIAGALDYLATRPDVVKGKIGIIGHSHGGSTVIRSAQSSFALDKRGLAAGVAYYPGCNPQFDTRHRHPGPAAGRRQGRLDAFGPLPKAGRQPRSRRSRRGDLLSRGLSQLRREGRGSHRTGLPPASSTGWSTTPWPHRMPRRGPGSSSRSTCA